MEWTLKLEEKGILGENMTFNETESTSAKEIPQQVNYYYGTIIHGDVSSSQIVSGNSNSIAYNATAAADAVQEIRESLERDKLSKEDMDSAVELLDEISEKIAHTLPYKAAVSLFRKRKYFSQYPKISHCQYHCCPDAKNTICSGTFCQHPG